MEEMKIELDIVKSFDEKTGTLMLDLTEEQRDLLIEYAVNDILRRALDEHEKKMPTKDDYEHNDFYYDINRNR